MARRTLVPILLIMVLLILLTTKSMPSSASAGPVQNQVETHRLPQESGMAADQENQPGSSPSPPKTAIRSGGSGLYLIK